MDPERSGSESGSYKPGGILKEKRSVRVEGGAISLPSPHGWPLFLSRPRSRMRRWAGGGIEGSGVVHSWGADPSPGWLPTHFLIGTRSTEAERAFRGLVRPLPSYRVKPSESPCHPPADVGGGAPESGATHHSSIRGPATPCCYPPALQLLPLYGKPYLRGPLGPHSCFCPCPG